MLRTGIICCLLILSAKIFAQETGSKSGSFMATVNVSVTNTKGKPSKGELVAFTGQQSKKVFSGITSAAGKFSIQLPPGDDYLVSVKSINDSTKYGMISIPSLEPGQFFTEPFSVAVEYEAAKSYTLDDVHFDFGKSALRPDSYKQLDELLDYLRNKENVIVEIAGHTDNVGKPADNKRLSEERAKAIVNYLVKKGIAASRLRAKGYGDTEPVADNSTDQGRQLNRRTEVRILN